MQADVADLTLGLYEGLLDGPGLLPALTGLAARIGASGHAVHSIRYRQGKPVSSVSAAQGGLAGPALDDYARYWIRHDPWARAGGAMPPGVHDAAAHVSPDMLRRSRFWNEWARAQDAAFHALAVPVLQRGDVVGGVFFHRREREAPFAPEQAALLETIFPHLRRIFAAEARLAPAREGGAGLLRAGLDALPDGIALFDTAARMVFANAALVSMAAQQDGLALGLVGLEVPDPGVRQALGRAVTAALAAAHGKLGLLPSAGSLSLPRRSGRAPWMVRAVPVLPGADAEPLSGFRGAMLLITDGERRPRPAAALLARLFGLTAAEGALAAALAAGRSIEEHANRRGVSRETVRSQMAAIRRKTGCRKQTDLVALFAKLPG